MEFDLLLIDSVLKHLGINNTQDFFGLHNIHTKKLTLKLVKLRVGISQQYSIGLLKTQIEIQYAKILACLFGPKIGPGSGANAFPRKHGEGKTGA